MASPQPREEDIVRQLATEIRILEGSIGALQSRLDIVRAAINEVTLAFNTLDGLKNMQDGDSTLVPVGAGSYVRMTIADSKKLVMGIGAGAAMEKDVESSVGELKGRLEELDKARTSIQQQLDQTVARYQQDRDALEELLRHQNAPSQAAS
ncbi:MAG: prefoldin subunit alpha [Candidatus Bathyarchaeia archaeon]|jgi:prefoldin alpha subunit